MQGEDTDRATFIDRVRAELRTVDYVQLVNAYQLYKALHAEQNRRDGARYVTHPRAVAEILMDFGPSSQEEIITALLHDTIEDAFILPHLLEAVFGPHVSHGVLMLTKYEVQLRDHGFIEKVKLDSPAYYGRLARADRFIRRVKLADRIHNLRTMSGMGIDHQRKQVGETRQFILPIARVTDDRMTAELERLCDEWDAWFKQPF